MSPSSLPARRLLSDTDSATFAPPLPPEAFGWRRPGPAILKFEGQSEATPVLHAGPTPPAPFKGSKAVTALTKGSHEAPAPSKDLNAASTPVKILNAPSTPVKSLNAATMQLVTPKATPTAAKGHNATSTPRRGSSEVPTSSPESPDPPKWNRRHGLPSQAMPREAQSYVIGMQDDPRSFYRYKRTCGPQIDHPSEDAGPIADRRRVDAPAMTISNAYGNLRIHVVSTDTVQVWYLGKTPDKKAVWVEAKAGDAHPDEDGLPNIVLSMAKPYKPQWIRGASFDTQQYPSRQIQRQNRIKVEPY